MAGKQHTRKKLRSRRTERWQVASSSATKTTRRSTKSRNVGRRRARGSGTGKISTKRAGAKSAKPKSNMSTTRRRSRRASATRHATSRGKTIGGARRKRSSTLPSVKRVSSVDDHEDYPGQTLRTTDHEVIQTWAEERGAIPASVPGSRFQGHRGVLRLDFPNFGGRGLEHIDWDLWFDAFDARKLEFVYQEHRRDGNQSNFFQLDLPETAWR